MRVRKTRDGGSATVLMLGLVAVAGALALVVATAGSVTAARHRVQGAADLAALAGAEADPGSDRCARAARVARVNAADLTDCRVTPEGVVGVRVSASVDASVGTLFGLVTAVSAEARAGRPQTW